MPFDVKKYIDSLELDDAGKSALQKVFANEKNVAEMTRGYAARDEASRLMDEGTKAKTEAEALRLAATTDKTEAEKLRLEAAALVEKDRVWAAELQKYQPANVAIEAERNELAATTKAYEAYLESIGVKPEYALEGRKPVAPPLPKEPVVPDPVKPATLDAEEMKRLGLVTAQQVQPAINLLGNIPFELNKIQFKHARLYGKEVPDAELDAIQEAFFDVKNERSLSTIASERLHFAERESAIAEEALNARAEKMAQERYEKRMSELQIPGAVVDSIQPSMEPMIHLTSKAFAENSSRPSEGMVGVSAEQMAEFLAVDQQLAAQGVRPE